MDRIEHTIFARHVMCFRRHRPQRRTPQNIFAQVRSNQIDQIGVATGKLFHLYSRLALRQVLVQR